MGRIDGERRQDRKDVQQEMIFEPFAFSFADLAAVDDGESGGGKVDAQIAPAFELLLDQQHDALADFLKLLGRGHALLGRRQHASTDLTAQTRDAHHEELVEIVSGDRDEAQLLEQRVIAIGGFFEDAAVEFEPGEFAIDEAMRRGREFLRALRQLREDVHDGNVSANAGGGEVVLNMSRHVDPLLTRRPHWPSSRPSSEPSWPSCSAPRTSAAMGLVIRRPRESASRSRLSTRRRTALSVGSSRVST